jgi:SAM-dependent methyltransferase
MHLTAYRNAELFFNKYIKHKTGFKVIDLGSKDFNGCLKPIFEKNCLYTGVDMDAGKNVDVVCGNDAIPFDDKSFNVVLSSSCFEHDGMFWLTFLEMCRLAKSGGYLYIQAPANGPYHAYPWDCWRFYLDSWKALEKWGVRNGYDIKLVDRYISKPSKRRKAINWLSKVFFKTQFNAWHDSVGIFQIK